MFLRSIHLLDIAIILDEEISFLHRKLFVQALSEGQNTFASSLDRRERSLFRKCHTDAVCREVGNVGVSDTFRRNLLCCLEASLRSSSSSPKQYRTDVHFLYSRTPTRACKSSGTAPQSTPASASTKQCRSRSYSRPFIHSISSGDRSVHRLIARLWVPELQRPWRWSTIGIVKQFLNAYLVALLAH